MSSLTAHYQRYPHRQPHRLQRAFDLSLPDQDLQILVDMDSRAGALVFEQFDLRSGDSDVSATGRAINPSQPEIVLNVDSDRLDLSPWLAL